MNDHHKDFLSQLKEVAGEATPGPWRAGKWTHDPQLHWQVFCDHLEVCPCVNVTLERDAQFIAMTSPSTVKWMIEVLEEVEGLYEAADIYANLSNILDKLTAGPQPGPGVEGGA